MIEPQNYDATAPKSALKFVFKYISYSYSYSALYTVLEHSIHTVLNIIGTWKPAKFWMGALWK